MQIVNVIVPVSGLLFPLSYIAPKDKNINIGDIVLVPFRNKEITSIVWEINVSPLNNIKLKFISNKIQFSASVKYQLLDFIKRSSNYYLVSLSTIAKLVLPVELNHPPIISMQQTIPKNVKLAVLSSDQKLCLNNFLKATKPVVIKGATGSGKTEIYFHAVFEQIKLGKQALIMLPEIALSNQIITKFKERFTVFPVIWNSTISKAQKKRILRGIISGEIQIIIGTRSSLFLPYKSLGIIVIDEEHDNSYKQNEGVLYHARDMAVLRSNIEQCKCLLLSATPSIETIYNVNLNKYHLITLKNRFFNSILPTIEMVDMRKEKPKSDCLLSTKLIQAINYTLSKKQQVLLFLNRRGFAPLILCKSCGFSFQCKWCSSFMVVHKLLQRLKCHYCGYVTNIPVMCIYCKSKDSLIFYGPGIERVAEQVTALFPNKKISLISGDNSKKVDSIKKLLMKMEKGEINILIGTQIITKGYHFPKLTLVGVIDADIGFTAGDLRTSEKMYQLLHQVGGRAGREHDQGLVLLQTHNPNNKVLLSIKEGSDAQFIAAEINSRKLAQMPPFTRMAAITFSGKDKEKVFEIANSFVTNIPKTRVKILGPAEPIIFRLAARYRYRVLLISDKLFNLQQFIKTSIESIRIPSFIHIKNDIDPYNFY